MTGLVTPNGTSQINAAVAQMQALFERMVDRQRLTDDKVADLSGRVEAAPNQAAIDGLRREAEDARERMAHSFAEEVEEKISPILKALERIEGQLQLYQVKADLGADVDRIINDREDRQAKARAAQSRERRQTLQLRLSIALAIVSLLGSAFVVLKFALRWV